MVNEADLYGHTRALGFILSELGATKVELSLFGCQNVKLFFVGISFTLYHRFSLLKLRIRNLTFSC